jgi:hypothetical protein
LHGDRSQGKKAGDGRAILEMAREYQEKAVELAGDTSSTQQLAPP